MRRPTGCCSRIAKTWGSDVEAGRLRHRVTLQRRVESQGSTGEVTWTWQDEDVVWAAVEPIQGREFFASQQVQAEVTTRIRIRYRPNIDAKMRVKHVTDAGSPGAVVYYGIEAVINPKHRRRELQLMCRERDAEGWRD